MKTTQTVAVTLGKPHTHEGKRYAAGDTIEVQPDQAAWLAARGVINNEPTADS